MRKKWHYQGDVDIEHGGAFYCIDELEYGYAEAVRVYPCYAAGAQDNCWWVEEHTVNIPRTRDRIERALDYCGISTSSGTPLMCVAALHEYGEYDQESSVTVQIGPDDPFYKKGEPVKPGIKLRADTNLEKWVRRRYHLGGKK